MRATTVERVQSSHVFWMCLAAWAVPGAGHLLQNRWQKGVVFLVVLPLMFILGLAMHGRIFPFEFSEPLVGLAAVGELGVGVLYFLTRLFGYGTGTVTAVTYEYGYAFMIVAGLLNMLVVLDAFDIALGRK